jgi:glycosyltransferase involved in cell wall biosynthesis
LSQPRGVINFFETEPKFLSTSAISVIIPVYNREAEIGRCLTSLLQQDFQDFEAVVVNDASTDGTAKAVESIGDPRIRIVHLQENRGHSAAGNIGIHAALGPLVCFLDSDDEFLPHKLSFIVGFFRDQSEIEVLVDSFEFVTNNHQGSRVRVHKNRELRQSREIEDAVYRRKLWKATGAISARRDALIKAGLWDESLKRRTDMDFILRLAQSCRCASTSAVLWRKRSNSTAISSQKETFISALIDIVQRHPKYTSKFRWRSGLARDITYHMLTVLLRTQYNIALNDWKQLIRFFGVPRTVYYIVLGSIMLLLQVLKNGLRV